MSSSVHLIYTCVTFGVCLVSLLRIYFNMYFNDYIAIKMSPESTRQAQAILPDICRGIDFFWCLRDALDYIYATNGVGLRERVHLKESNILLKVDHSAPDGWKQFVCNLTHSILSDDNKTKKLFAKRKLEHVLCNTCGWIIVTDSGARKIFTPPSYYSALIQPPIFSSISDVARYVEQYVEQYGAACLREEPSALRTPVALPHSPPRRVERSTNINPANSSCEPSTTMSSVDLAARGFGDSYSEMPGTFDEALFGDDMDDDEIREFLLTECLKFRISADDACHCPILVYPLLIGWTSE